METPTIEGVQEMVEKLFPDFNIAEGYSILKSQCKDEIEKLYVQMFTETEPNSFDRDIALKAVRARREYWYNILGEKMVESFHDYIYKQYR